MSKWRHSLDRVTKNLEDILESYETLIRGRTSPEDKQTYDDELVPVGPKVTTQGTSVGNTNDTDYRPVWRYEQQVRDLMEQLNDPSLSLQDRKYREKDLKSTHKKLQTSRIRFVGKMEVSMVSRSKNNWMGPKRDGEWGNSKQGSYQRLWVTGHPLGEGKDKKMSVKTLWEMWYDGKNETYNKTLTKNGDDVSRYGDHRKVPHYVSKVNLERDVEEFDLFTDNGSQWLYENFYQPFILHERYLNREKFHQVPKEIFIHRNKVLEVFREIEDFKDREIRRDLTGGELKGKRKPEYNYLPDEPTPYHVVPKNGSVSGVKKFKEEVGDYEERGWRNVLPHERKTPRKTGGKTKKS
jgi:hypothetical protein